MYQNKSIGLISAIAIGIGGMIGAGIFSILGLVTEISGNVVYISFIFGGVIALLSTYSYAKLGTKYPSAGGAVEFLIRGFGDGILSGGFNFLLWFGYVFALAVYAEGFGNYAATFLPPQIAGIGVTVFAVAVILLFTLINVFGAKSVGRFEILIVTVKLVILLGFACVGLFFIKPSLLIISQISHVSNVIIGACILFIGYEGFGLITNTAEDIDQPQKNIPRALYIAVFLTILIYIFVSIVLVGNLSITEITRAADYALAAAAEPFAGSIGFTIIAIGALFSTASAINATLFGGANVSYLMAKKGELPKLFNRNTWHNSKEGLFITSLLVIIITVFLDLGSVAMMGSAAFLLIYAGVNIAHLKIYKKTKANKYIIILAIIGCIFSFSVLVYYEIFNSPITLITLVTVIFASFLIEWIYRQYTQRKLKNRNIN